MKQFEYLNQTSTNIQRNADLYPPNPAKGIVDTKQRGLNYLGLQGWELVNFTSNGEYIFKRELPPSPEHTHERGRSGYDGGYGQ
jgi:hypothetical protein